ncbi:hypothetical protein SCLCIDRAFT_29259 [Scleroderma citrinum Foug A]|uniref:Uncharacterized protein n=1 Tax=Scleroderma citrinum Foug A TaxID=1036808 RepID=A0A0C3DL87_9AGAM|nr:hypothetical protein SCLCIDRAFT_29259 [Scleroderma citrinum Foug A]
MSLQDWSNYSADIHGAKGKKVTQGSTPSDDHSSLPPSSLPVDLGDSDTKIDVNENTPLRCKKSKTHQSCKEANAMTVKPGCVEGRGNNEPQVPRSPSAWDILVTAGFGVKPSHTKVNDVNLFHSWYWVTQPKPEGASRNEFNNTITKEYNELMKDIPKDDVAARREKLKCVYEWQETSTVVPSNKSVKSIVTRLENVKVQFSDLAESWSNLEEIEIVGILMYVGEDPARHQLSGIFGGSDMVRQFINECAIDLCALMDKYTAIFKNSDGSTTSLIGNSGSSALDPACHDCAQPLPRPSRNSDSSPATPKLIAVPQLNPGHYVNLQPRTSFLDETLNLVQLLLDPQLYYSSIPDATPIPSPGLPHIFFLARSPV